MGQGRWKVLVGWGGVGVVWAGQAGMGGGGRGSGGQGEVEALRVREGSGRDRATGRLVVGVVVWWGG